MKKTCRSCGLEKPIADFFKWRKMRDGLRGQCKACCALTRRKRYRNDPAVYEKMVAIWRADPKRYYVAHALRSAKTRARKKGVPFNLSREDIPTPDRCPVLGIPLDYGLKQQKHAIASSPALDRIYPAQGYVKHNVQVISMRANNIKSNATPEEIMAVARYLELFA